MKAVLILSIVFLLAGLGAAIFFISRIRDWWKECHGFTDYEIRWIIAASGYLFGFVSLVSIIVFLSYENM